MLVSSGGIGSMDALARWTAIASPWVEISVSEPELTEQERNRIAAKAERSAIIIKETESWLGHYRADAAQEYVLSHDGTAMPKSYLSRLTEQDYELSLTAPNPWKAPFGGSSWLFRNVIFQSEAQKWLLSRISSENCVVAGVDVEKLDAGKREQSRDPSVRVLGIDYVRVGFPRSDWEYVMESLEATVPGCMTAGFTKSLGEGAITKTYRFY